MSEPEAATEQAYYIEHHTDNVWSIRFDGLKNWKRLSGSKQYRNASGPKSQESNQVKPLLYVLH